MNQEEHQDISLDQLEILAKNCQVRKQNKKKSKLLAFDSANHEMEKYQHKGDLKE